MLQLSYDTTSQKGEKMNKKRIIVIVVIILASLIIIGLATLLGINAYVINTSKDRIISPDEATKITDVDCILVLGCLVQEDGTPSDRLADRVYGGVNLYKLGCAPKIIMSGDHGRADYDEVGAMKRTAVNEGVPSSDIFMDHAGFSTYESLYRAKEIFGADKIIIVTQEYHLYRALYIAEQLGIEAYGVDTAYRTYGGEWMRDIREILARFKDLVYTAFKPEPEYLGEKISLLDDGNITND